MTTFAYLSSLVKVQSELSKLSTTKDKTEFLTHLGGVIDRRGGQLTLIWMKKLRSEGELADVDFDDETNYAGCRAKVLQHFRSRLGVQTRAGGTVCGMSEFDEEGNFVESAAANTSEKGQQNAKKIAEAQRQNQRELAGLTAMLSGAAREVSWLVDDPRDAPQGKIALTPKKIELGRQLRNDQKAHIEKMHLSQEGGLRLNFACNFAESIIYRQAYDEDSKLRAAAQEALSLEIFDGTTPRPASKGSSIVEVATATAWELLHGAGGASAGTMAKDEIADLKSLVVSFAAPAQDMFDYVIDAAENANDLAFNVTNAAILEGVTAALKDWVGDGLNYVESSERADFLAAQVATLCAELKDITQQATISRLWKRVDREVGGAARTAHRLLLVLLARVHLYLLHTRSPTTPLHFPSLGAHSTELLKHFVEYAACRADEFVESAAADERLAHSATAMSAKPKSKASAAATGQVTQAMTNKRHRAMNKWKRHKSVRDGSFGREHPSGAVERVVAMLGNHLHSFANIPTGPAMWGDRVKMSAILAEWDAHCDAAQLNPLTALPRE
jgi:hypothetical protein